jgi:two-component system phosphate regulon response regulator OmpR
MTQHILVVDDELELRAMLEEYLGRHGYAVSLAEHGAAMRQILADRQVDLVILDIRMPGEDGLSLARSLRATNTIPIIMLTASGEVMDRIIGIELGADDYLAKPFDPRELLARIRSVLRRAHAPDPPNTASREIAIGRCRLDLNAHRLFAADGTEIAITAMEFDLLRVFATNPNRVLSREQLLDLTISNNSDPFDRSIDVRISRLRRKVEDNPDKPQAIRTVRGSGYVFVPIGAVAPNFAD